jgi:hypothetical protein
MYATFVAAVQLLPWNDHRITWQLTTLHLYALAGERLSPWVGLSCIIMGFSILFT